MPQMRKRRQKREENLEDGWQTRQKRKTNPTHHRLVRVLRQNLQECLREEKNLSRQNLLQPLFSIFHAKIQFELLCDFLSIAPLFKAPWRCARPTLYRFVHSISNTLQIGSRCVFVMVLVVFFSNSDPILYLFFIRIDPL